MDDGAQAVGVLPDLFDEGEDAGLVGEIRLQAEGALGAQLLDAGLLAAVADDQPVAVLQQAQRAMQADALAGAGDQDGGRSSAHASLVRFEGTPISERPAGEIEELYQPADWRGTALAWHGPCRSQLAGDPRFQLAVKYPANSNDRQQAGSYRGCVLADTLPVQVQAPP
ncbi:hypothetical protein D3C76_1148660 [compost metagenome]